MNNIKQKKTKLKQVQLVAIPIILGERTIIKGCEKAGVSRSQFYKWMNENEFREEFNKMKDLFHEKIKDATFNGLKDLYLKAFETLSHRMDSKNDSIAIKAAEAAIKAINFLKEQQMEEQIIREMLND